MGSVETRATAPAGSVRLRAGPGVDRDTNAECRGGRGRTRDTPWGQNAGDGESALSRALVGAVALAATKAVDLATTVVGLELFSAVDERNPLVAAVIARNGLLPGLLGAAGVTVVFTVVIIEGAFALTPARWWDGAAGSPGAGRVICYGVGCGCNLAFGAYNAALIIGFAVGWR